MVAVVVLHCDSSCSSQCGESGGVFTVEIVVALSRREYCLYRTVVTVRALTYLGDGGGSALCDSGWCPLRGLLYVAALRA